MKPENSAGRRPILLGTLLVLTLAACGDDRYEQRVDASGDAPDPTDAQTISPPPTATSKPRSEQREPLQVVEDEVIDPVGGGRSSGREAPERAGRTPLEHPSRAPQVDPAGEPMDPAVPDEPTRSMDPTRSPAIDPVGERRPPSSDDQL
jgi:hypothetical protein